MSEIMEPYYVSMLKGHGFTPDPDDHQYGALGICWKLSPEIGEGSYWTYGQKDLYDIKIHNFSFHKDSLLEFPLPECLSITRYNSISGEEITPYRRLSAGCIKTYIGGYEPYQVLIHKNIPIPSSQEILPRERGRNIWRYISLARTTWRLFWSAKNRRAWCAP